MNDGFIKVAVATPKITVADVQSNIESIKNLISSADEKKANIVVFPELSITGCTCKDLFFNETLTSSAKKGLLEIAEYTADKYPVVAVGLPIDYNSQLYNCVAVIKSGSVLGIVPKTNIQTNSIINESRYFNSAYNLNENSYINFNDSFVPFGNNLLFKNDNFKEFCFGVEIGSDLLSYAPISQELCINGANIIINPSCFNQTAGSFEIIKNTVASVSKRLNCSYISASGSDGESTTDIVFSAFGIIAENGNIVSYRQPFNNNSLLISEIDVKLSVNRKHKNKSLFVEKEPDIICFSQETIETELTREIEKNPFLPKNINKDEYLEEILKIQSYALAQRISHTRSQKAVIGISGGLDSTLALLVAVRALKLLNRLPTDILAITMPCFGTTKRTRSNSEILCNELDVSFKEINIGDAVKQHFKDIEQSDNVFDATYENSQARERTQVLMDIANKVNGMVIGTGDLSELALGWATYNGDHMSMYGVNAGVPKTLIRYIVEYEANKSTENLKKVLLNILDTPVSPELLPADDKGDISQKTEDLVGPYELHDFFIYHTLCNGMSPKKIYRMAVYSFDGIYDKETILKWLKIFTRRFFTQQFKRSCLPDGPKVFDISLSPRGDWQMPSDASYNLWLAELEEI